MNMFRFLPPASLLVLVPFAVNPAGAQEVVQALPGTTDADALADDMRRLATNPRDVDALVDAARLSMRLEDARAAAAFLQRAENIDPHNPRVRAGQAVVLLQSERPGQALRYFAEAEARGLGASSFAADRGLAYDLTGQQERAQRDYVRALRDRPDEPETVRRYALSLGISGQRQRAIALLDPLVRRSDRAAWRAQAFVLAMTGDVAGASRIAATMMPGGAAGLSAFFARLPSLSPVDRAFAVHFGQVRASPERLADSRLAPPLSPPPREPVVLASAQPSLRAQPVVPPVQRGRRDRARAQSQTPAPVIVASAPSAPSPRRDPVGPLTSPPARAIAPTVAAQATAGSPLVPAAAVPARSASLNPAARVPLSGAAGTPVAGPAARQVASAPRVVAPSALPSATPVQLAAASAAQPSAAIPASAKASLPAAVPVTSGGAASPLTAVPPTPAATQPVQIAGRTPAITASSAAPGFTYAAPAQVVVSPASALPSAVGPAAAVIPSRTIAGAGEDSILARIVANLSIPAAELGVVAPQRPVPAAEPASVRPEPVLAERPGTSPADKLAADKLAADRAAAAKALADRRAAERKAAADRKALADKKAAADKKALTDLEVAEKKIERANPERIWVQIAGGANEGDLRRAYAAVKAKAPAVIGSRGGWTTPLRATNRVLTGPFKSAAEARAFVNDLNKAGVGAFTFTSDPGQPVKRLADT